METLAVSGSTVYAGGEFSSIGGQPRSFIGAVDAVTGDATAFDPESDSYVLSLAVSGSTVYAGGYFSQLGGQFRLYAGAVDAETGLATGWDAQAKDVV